MLSVVHHYAPMAFPSRLKVPDLESDSVVLSAAWRQDKPALYVQKPALVESLKRVTLEAFFVGTGHDFNLPEGFRFIGTVTPDNFYFFHVYARLA